MSEPRAAYHIETITQRLARLGIELAELRKHEHDTPMTVEALIRLNDRMSVIMVEILQLSENWEPSNE
jgi:hypothetical protein